ncbi:flavin-containing monooxygenase [Streptomyces sp. NPDC092296]|uniref:flavin-containing monooxygenase n=1 Tax=Streptomyces sp. NPDC092296 TaxID=3366012 RepID=UPI003815778F
MPTAHSTDADPAAAPEHVDVLIVGAGLSGIGAACHLRQEAPGTTYAILEARGASGGTWDLFRYPGVRSDSDMFTLGYAFRPWQEAKSIAGGAEILHYLRETATEYGVDEHIRYHSRVVRADWSTPEARWTVTVEHTDSGARTTHTCRFLHLCSGYYRYDEGYTPAWPGREDFTGTVVHPQHWPADLDIAGKRVVVIGSGATAFTLVPALAATASRVTMLQRSPSFVMSVPVHDPVARLLRRVLPEHRAHALTRWKNVRVSIALYGLCRRYPARMRALIRKGVLKRLPAGYDVDTHFNPPYQPWDQRMCLVPNGDFFRAIRSGKAEVVTDHIDAFTASGLRLRSGARLEAEVIVTATGLDLLPLGGIELAVDGEPVLIPERVAYKAMMLDGVPNLAFALGYTNASWTLKVDLVSSYVARLLRAMARSGYAVVTPRLPREPIRTTPFVEMTSGYFQRSRALLPLQGDRAPWRLWQHYRKDALLFGEPLDDAELEFRPAAAPAGRPRR